MHNEWSCMKLELCFSLSTCVLLINRAAPTLGILNLHSSVTTFKIVTYHWLPMISNYDITATGWENEPLGC